MVRDDELAIDREAPGVAMSAEANTKVDRSARASDGRSLPALFASGKSPW